MNLQAYFDQAAERPYKEAEHDCCTFLTEWIDLKLGTNFRGELNDYRTILEGRRKHAPSGIPERISEEMEKLEIQLSSESIPGSIGVLDSGYAGVIGDDGFCYTLANGLSGILKIHPRHILHYYVLEKA